MQQTTASKLKLLDKSRDTLVQNFFESKDNDARDDFLAQCKSVCQAEFDDVIQMKIWLGLNILCVVLFWTVAIFCGTLLRGNSWVSNYLAEQINSQTTTALIFLLTFMFDHNLRRYDHNKNLWENCITSYLHIGWWFKDIAKQRKDYADLMTKATALLILTKCQILITKQESDWIGYCVPRVSATSREEKLKRSKMIQQHLSYLSAISNKVDHNRQNPLCQQFIHALFEAQTKCTSSVIAQATKNMILVLVFVVIVVIVATSHSEEDSDQEEMVELKAAFHAIVVVGIIFVPYFVTLSEASGDFVFEPCSISGRSSNLMFTAIDYNMQNAMQQIAMS